MKNKKLFQIIIISVVALWVFSVSLMVGISKVKKQRSQLPPLTPQTEQATSSSTTAATTTEATPDVTIDGNLVNTLVTSMNTSSTQQSTSKSVSQTAPSVSQSTVPSTKKEIINAYLNAVNKLKETPSFKLVVTEDMVTVVDEMSPSSVKPIVNKVIESNTQSEPVTYVFSNGIDTATGMSPNYTLPPFGRNAQLNESAVTNTRSTSDSDGGYTLYISLGRETQTLSTPAPNYSTVMQVIELDDLGLPSAAKIDSYNVTYDNSTIEAKFDKDNRITNMRHYITVTDSQGDGSLVFSVSLSGHGSCTTTYQITY